MRCFVGIVIPDHMKSKVLGIQDVLKGLLMVCKFVEPKNLHICLSFLGDADENRVKKISGDLDSICGHYPSFEVSVLGVKPIPNERYFRVLALDIAKTDALDAVNWEIREKIGGDMNPPHLTLCRVKKVLEKQKVLKKLSELRVSAVGNFTVHSIALIHSTLEKTGPVYDVLHDSKLISEA